MTSSELQLAFPPFRSGCRTSGVLMHVTSLPSPYGIGDVGPAAFAWVGPAPRRWPKTVASAAVEADRAWQIALLMPVFFCGKYTAGQPRPSD